MNIKEIGFVKGLIKDTKEGIQKILPLIKGFLKHLRVAYYDKCCNEVSESGLPTGFFTGDSTLKYYDPITNTYITINNGGLDSTDWKLAGNTISGSEFIGTVNNKDFIVKTNNTQVAIVDKLGNLGIGITPPVGRLHVAFPTFALQPVFERQQIPPAGPAFLTAGCMQVLENTLSTSIASYTNNGITGSSNSLGMGINFAIKSNTDALKNIAAISAMVTNYATGRSNLNFSVNGSGITSPSMILHTNGGLALGGVVPDPSAILDLSSTTRAFLLPRMTKAQRNAIASPVAGLAIYQTDNTPGLRVFNSTNWIKYTETTD